MYRAIETFRGIVYPWSIDHVGHMNVQAYTAKFDEASWQFLGRLGMTVAAMAPQARSFVALDQHIRYKREVVAGTLLHIETELVDIGRSSVRMIHRMFNSATGDEIAVSEIVGAYFDTARRTTTPLPDSFRRQADAQLGVPLPSLDALALGLEPALDRLTV